LLIVKTTTIGFHGMAIQSVEQDGDETKDMDKIRFGFDGGSRITNSKEAEQQIKKILTPSKSVGDVRQHLFRASMTS
jgi:hypothetical protein